MPNPRNVEGGCGYETFWGEDSGVGEDVVEMGYGVGLERWERREGVSKVVFFVVVVQMVQV